MEFSVVIPTFNRVRELTLTLRALARQSFSEDYEVIVVDDGSTDDTGEAVGRLAQGFPVPLRYHHQQNRKQGAARNHGAKRAEGRFLVFLGDDTVPAPDFLRRHAESHRGRDDKVVAIGYTPYATEYPRTRFMEYIGERGWQFGFALIEDPDDVPFNFFYTSNISISRSFFNQSGGFDEDFREYGWEDVELSWRLSKMGMRLIYNPKAVAHHHHPTTIRSFVRRQRKVGASAWTFYRKHPEMKDFLSVGEIPDYSPAQRLKLSALTRLCSLTERLRWPDLSRYYPDIMSYHYNRGLAEAGPDHS